MSDRGKTYEKLMEALERTIEGEGDMIARMSSAACLLHGAFERFLWTGFYRLSGPELVVGPYQGTLGCLRIAVGVGVCGTAALKKSALVVDDVHAFPGHIACDSRSRSEIVVPVRDESGELIGVLDVDSDRQAAFNAVDRDWLERIADLVGAVSGDSGGRGEAASKATARGRSGSSGRRARARRPRAGSVRPRARRAKSPGHGRPPIRAIISRLKREYPDSRIALDFRNPLELLIATILAAQCTDERVNQVTRTLFRRYKSASAYARASLEELMEIVRPTGFYRNKSRSIQAACRIIAGEHGGDVPQTMEELVRLPGVARKTANIVLGDAYGVSEGIAVDTHMLRLARRLGLTSEREPVKVERDLCGLVPRARWIEFPHLIADHGRAVCAAREPLCAACVLADLCPSRGAILKGRTPRGR